MERRERKADQTLLDIRAAMIAVNFFVLGYYSLLCAATTLRVCRSFEAYSFLASVQTVPEPPLAMPVRALGGYVLLTAVMVGKSRAAAWRWPALAAVCVGEMGVCFGVIASVRFYYSGVALLVLADLVYTVQHSRFRLWVMAALVALYAFGQYEIVSFGIHSVPFSAYLNYYRSGIRGWFTGVESLMVSLNILLFVLFMILLFTGQKAETARVRKLNEQLNAANRQLKTYALEMERMTELRERNRLAREIHDTLGHALTGITMSAEACLVMLDRAPEEVRQRLKIIQRTARNALTDVRRSIKALRPDALEQRDLAHALEELIEQFTLTTSAQVRYEPCAGEMNFAPDEDDTIYRVVQESLTNAVRHGGATRIEVALSRSGKRLTVSVRDNGSGSAQVEEGFGLRHMRERLELLGGKLSYGSRTEPEEHGFYVTAELRLRETEEKEHD